jgi:hypothetical protein
MLTMEQEYLQELFSFQAELQFHDPRTGIFQMEPTEECAQTLNSYDLHFKAKDDGFGIMAPFILHEDTSLMELKNQFREDVKLAFAIFTKEPNFFKEAELPEETPGEYVYYLNNLNENERRTQLLLLENCGIKVSERVKLHPKQFSWPVVRNADDQIVPPRVFGVRGNEIVNTQYDFAIDTILNTYNIDLSRLGDGLFTIEYNSERITYYCAKASFIRRVPLLILEVFADPSLNEKYRITKLVNGIQYLDPKQFGIHFGDYSYYWKYVIIPVNIPPCTWLKTQTNDSQYWFLPEKVKVMNLDPIIFTSNIVIDTPNEALQIRLFRENWGSDCRLSSQKYKDCDQDYWIEVDKVYWCRYKDGYGHYKYKCPARCTDDLIGLLPKPGEVYTKYYLEDGKKYAQMTFYLVKENNQYVLKPTYDPTGEFTYKVFGEHGDVTIQFINNVVVVKVTLHFEIPGRMGRYHFHMHKLGGVYSTDHLFHRVFPYFRMKKGETINYSFTYELSNKQKITSATYTYVIND